MLPFAIDTFLFDRSGIESWIEKMPAQMKGITTLKMPLFILNWRMQSLCLKNFTGLKRIVIITNGVKLYEGSREILEGVFPGIEIVLQR